MAFATVDRYVVIADTLKTMQRVLETSRTRAADLKGNRSFREMMGRLPDDRLR